MNEERLSVAEVVRLDWWRRLEAAENAVDVLNERVALQAHEIYVLRRLGRYRGARIFVSGMIAGALIPLLGVAISMWWRH